MCKWRSFLNTISTSHLTGNNSQAVLCSSDITVSDEGSKLDVKITDVRPAVASQKGGAVLMIKGTGMYDSG